ncbi:hypothetical protein [Dyella japonica]|uniref:hypothetical protein n=1 Tax=Dyella japonica TaxID=231455 RepID=UPI00069A23B8|nr:hypothetical protein [Dyella japonica]
MNTDFSSQASAGRRDIRQWLWPAALLALGMLLITFHQSDYFKAVPGDIADARFNNLVLEHLYRWITGHDASLWSPGFFYPYQGALAFSDNHFGTGLIYIVQRALGLTPEMAFIGWYTFAAPLNFVACYIALRRFGLGVGGASVGAFIFSFSFIASSQTGHAQLAYRFATPLALLAWQRWLTAGDLKQLAITALWITLQFYCSIYLGYFALLLLLAYAIAQSIALWRVKTTGPYKAIKQGYLATPRRDKIYVAIAIAACAVALLAMFYPYLYYSHLYGFRRDYGEVQTMLPRLASYVLMDGSRIWGPFSAGITDMPMRNEQQMFFGAVAWLLALVGATGLRDLRARCALMALLVLFLLTLCVHGHSFYAYFYHLPLANAVRAVARIGLVMMLPVAMLAGLGFDRLLSASRHKKWPGLIVATALAACLVAEYAMYHTWSVPLVEWRGRVTHLQEQVPATLPADAIIYVPERADQRQFLNELDGMQLGQALDRNTLNGYSGNWPIGFSERDVNNCSVINNRLAGYAAQAKLSYNEYVALVNRVSILGTSQKCEPLGQLLSRTHFSGKLSRELPKDLVIDIENVQPEGKGLTLSLSVMNHSAINLPSVSDDNRPVRFSWRFVPLDASPSPDDGWDTRKDLTGDVAPGQTSRFSFPIAAPAQPGSYRLEVDMVQELVSWFHRRGMPIAKSQQTIVVDQDGSVHVSH